MWRPFQPFPLISHNCNQAILRMMKRSSLGDHRSSQPLRRGISSERDDLKGRHIYGKGHSLNLTSRSNNFPQCYGGNRIQFLGRRNCRRCYRRCGLLRCHPDAQLQEIRVPLSAFARPPHRPQLPQSSRPRVDKLRRFTLHPRCFRHRPANTGQMPLIVLPRRCHVLISRPARHHHAHSGKHHHQRKHKRHRVTSHPRDKHQHHHADHRHDHD